MNTRRSKGGGGNSLPKKMGGGVSHFQSLYACLYTCTKSWPISGGGGGGGKLRWAIITTTIEAQESFVTRQKFPMFSPRPTRYIIIVMSDLQSLQSKLSSYSNAFVCTYRQKAASFLWRRAWLSCILHDQSKVASTLLVGMPNTRLVRIIIRTTASGTIHLC